MEAQNGPITREELKDLINKAIFRQKDLDKQAKQFEDYKVQALAELDKIIKERDAINKQTFMEATIHDKTYSEASQEMSKLERQGEPDMNRIEHLKKTMSEAMRDKNNLCMTDSIRQLKDNDEKIRRFIGVTFDFKHKCIYNECGRYVHFDYTAEEMNETTSANVYINCLQAKKY